MSQEPARPEVEASPSVAVATEALEDQTSLGPGTNLAYLAESDPQLAFDEYNRRQSSVPENPHTPLRTIQQAQPACIQGDADATARARENFNARAATARRMNHESSTEDKVTYDVGLFATEDSSYLPCGIASMVDSHPAARSDPDKMGQYQRPPNQSTQKRSVWRTLLQIF